MTWGWLVAMVGIQSVAMSMAELCSSMPTSGGLYYASAVLAPPGWGPLAAWITGWSNWLVQITGAPSVNYGTAAMTLAAASIRNPNYSPKDWHVFLLTIFLMLIHGCMSSMPTRWLARTNSVGTIFNILALVVVVIFIPAGTNRVSRGLSKFTPSSEVWGTIYPGTDFPAGVGVLMSFVAVIWTMSGYDAPFHLAEECSNANIASPRAIVMTSAVGGTFGWFLQLVVAYTVVDVSCKYSPSALNVAKHILDWRRSRLRSRTALCRVSSAVHARLVGRGNPGSHHHCRIFHGSRLYDRRVPSHFCLCQR